MKLLLRLRIDEPADTERFRGDDSFARKPCDSLEKQFRITHGRTEQASGIGDAKFRGADGDRCKQLRIESVTDKLRVRVQTLQYGDVPRGDGSDTVGPAQHLISLPEVVAAEQPGDKLLCSEQLGERMSDIFAVAVLLDDVAQIDDERQAILPGDFSCGRQREAPVGTAKQHVVALLLEFFFRLLRHTSVLVPEKQFQQQDFQPFHTTS